MAVEFGIYQLLRDNPLVSSYVGGRIFGGRAPAGATEPLIVFQTPVTQDLGYHAQGASGLRMARLQFDSYAKKYADTIKVKDAVRSVLQSFSGNLPDGTPVNGCIVVRDMDFPFEPGNSGYSFRRLLEIDVQYTEAVLAFTPPNTIFPNITELEFDTIEDDGQQP
jgi:hypothetical protein